MIIKKYQEGGAAPMPAEAGAPMPAGPAGAPAPEQGGQDPIMMIAQAAMQALETQDCNIAMQVCEAFIGLLQGAQGAPEEVGAPVEQPVFKKGGKLMKKKACRK